MVSFFAALFSSHIIGSFWLTVCLGISYILQVVISALIILGFCCNKEFRKKPGSIILFYAISALGVSIIGGFEHYGSVEEDFCESLGFIALFFEYNCLYYEIGFIVFFICDFEEFLKKKFDGIKQAQIRQNLPQALIEPLVIDFEALEKRNPEEKAACEHLKKRLDRIQRQEAQLTSLQNLIDEKKNHIELLINKVNKLRLSVSRSGLQNKINFIVLILSVSSCLVPAFSDNLGPNMFGFCAEKFDPSKVQELSMGFYLFLATFNAIFSALGLISFYQQRKRIERKILRPLDRDLNEEEKKDIHHYILHVRVFIAVTTLCCWIFSGINIYAAATVMINPNSHWNYEWNEIKWDVLLFLHLFQGIAVLFFKLTESMVSKAVKETLGDCWRGLTACCRRSEEPSIMNQRVQGPLRILEEEEESKEQEDKETGIDKSVLKDGRKKSFLEIEGVSDLSSCKHQISEENLEVM